MTNKIAIVYDWIDSWGGVERILIYLRDEFPDADFYTSYTDYKRAPWAKKLDARTSFIQRLPPFIRSNRIFSLLFYPYAFERFDFSGYDVVISISSAFAKGIVTKPGTKHICYLLTPPRYLWGMSDLYIKNTFLRILVGPLLSALRAWDYIAAQRPDTIISISNAVARRCIKYYGRKSEVLYPPFDVNHWKKLKTIGNKSLTIHDRKPYYLVVSRLEPYKKVDLVIQTFNSRTDTLIIVGKGTQYHRLRGIAGTNISFMAHVSDQELARLYMQAIACILPQEEDFGYVALEAQYFGCPVVSYRRGGAVETLKEGSNAIFFDPQTPKALSAALARLPLVTYNVHINTDFTDQINQKYSLNQFLATIRGHINEHYY